MNTPFHTDIEQMEERLRKAMLSSDVQELDALIDDRLLFIGPDGNVYRKAEDLELHRSGAERIERLEIEEMFVEPHSTAVITVVLANMAGILRGQAFEGRFRYVRTWVNGEAGWRMVGGSVCAAPSGEPGSPTAP